MERPRDDWPSSYFNKFKYPNWNTSFEVLSYVEKLTMSNQNKKMSNLFLGTEFGKFMFFLSKVHQMLQQVLTEGLKRKKKESWLNSVFLNTTKFRIWCRNLIQFSDCLNFWSDKEKRKNPGNHQYLSQFHSYRRFIDIFEILVKI